MYQSGPCRPNQMTAPTIVEHESSLRLRTPSVCARLPLTQVDRLDSDGFVQPDANYFFADRNKGISSAVLLVVARALPSRPKPAPARRSHSGVYPCC
jgi:hypothetical protein